ncbi:MAG TPA: DinB family protein [Pirellulales bacterium]|jgi:hypothetical protein|nr:DinB family protein [Pirellulales bacterium]
MPDVFELARPTYNMMLGYAQKLVADVPDEKLCAEPAPGQVMNHPAFLLGHLAWAHDSRAAALSGQPPGPAASAEWKELFGMGAKPSTDRSRYPSKAELLKAFEEAHGRLGDAAANATAEALAQPTPEPMRNRFPTVGAMVLGLMTSHFATHLGQLSAWRRAMGFPSVF